MAEILPFRALRYDPARVPLADVVTQPYDKITPAMQERYYRAHPCNLVRIILANPALEAGSGRDVYDSAAAYLRDWRQRGILRPDPQPSLYFYAQRFAVPGEGEQERRGLIALGRLHDYADGVVFRHEQTHTRVKQDRLNLLRATAAQFGLLFMLYRDPQGALEAALHPASDPEVDLRDEYAVQHRLWRISEPSAIARVTSLMAHKKLVIADGHHRYETALAYRDERQAQLRVNANVILSEAEPKARAGVARASEAESKDPYPQPAPFDFAMMAFINMDAPGLVILPTHRVISGLPGFDKDLFLRDTFAYFTVEQAPSADPARLLALLHDAGRQGTALVAVIGPDAFLLRARPGAADSLLAGLSPRQRPLDVVHLHKVLLDHVLGIGEEAVRQQQNITYLRDAAEAIAQARSGANVAFLMNPVRIDQVRDIALAGEVLPQKSTDFYPKLLSGLTIYALE